MLLYIGNSTRWLVGPTTLWYSSLKHQQGAKPYWTPFYERDLIHDAPDGYPEPAPAVYAERAAREPKRKDVFSPGEPRATASARVTYYKSPRRYRV